MRIKHGLIDYQRFPEKDEILLFTGNAYVRNDGALVMGRGAAQQVRDHHVGIDKWFGSQIQCQGDNYGLIIHKKRIGVLQVKQSYQEPACLFLISLSAKVLKTIAWTFPNMLFTCNFPGIGNGGLDRDDVESVLDEINIPDNVEFWV